MTWNAYAQVYSAQVDPYLVSAANQINLRTVAATDAEHVLYGGSYTNNFSTTNPLYPFVRKLYHAPNRFSARFFYDALGRLVVSQNARQYNAPERKFSYTRYDALGRVVEVGEKTDPSTGNGLRFKQIFGAMVSGTYNPTVISETKLISWIENNDGLRREVTKSYYDEPLITQVPVTFDPHTQRKRITHVTYEEVYDNNDQTYDHASHFVYDIHGNVKTLVQDNRKMAVEFASLANQRFKRMDYTYDLVSGNVHRMSVTAVDTSGILQPADQWHHAYRYDADNRIVEVFTSRHTPLLNGGWSNAMLENELTENPDWHKDAHYVYYDHGPLARVELGKDQLQGLDYVYNLQGWLKGVNATSLTNTLDPGKDGVTTGANPVNGNFAKDVFAFSLHYHQGDYTPIGATAPAASIVNSDVAAHSTDLYNGNIRAMQTTLTNPNTRDIMPLANAYQYDQLNRLRESKSFTNLVANQWGFSGTYNDMYYNSFAYDANGNITQQIRLSQSGQKIEDMVYRYKTNSSGKLLRNRLYHINDEVDASDWADDIDDMGVFENNPLLIETANNYSYDEEGRLIKDTQEGIKEIVWRVDGKVRAVIFDSLSQKPHLLFDYDAFGRRIAKHLYDNQSEVLMKTTYYLRDASGNQLSTYVHEVLNEQTHFTLKELHLYGSSHLGMVADSVNLFTHTPSTHINTILGLRYYNLTNHLGNVQTTLSDIKIPLSDDNQTVSGYDAAIVNIYDYSPFGVYLDGRTIESKYMPFGFNGMQRDDELKGKGNSYTTEFRQYEPRLGRWLSLDPLAHSFPWQSPYVAFDNNPIVIIDPKGLAGESATNKGDANKSKAEKKFENKLDKWKRKHSKELEGMSKFEIEETFKFAHQGKKWVSNYENHTRTDGITGHKATISIEKDIIAGAASGGSMTLSKPADLGISSGQLQINYDMAGIPDRLVIKNESTGETLFDTKNLPEANRLGEVQYKKGSGIIINFDLGEGNTVIRILVNPDGKDNPGEKGSIFVYRLVINPNEIKNYTITDYQVDLKGKSGRKRYKKITR